MDFSQQTRIPKDYLLKFPMSPKKAIEPFGVMSEQRVLNSLIPVTLEVSIRKVSFLEDGKRLLPTQTFRTLRNLLFRRNETMQNQTSIRPLLTALRNL